MIKVESAWKELLSTLTAREPWHSAMVVGASDSGKTTLCRFLGTELAQQASTARIDADPGQSVIGPPTCLGLGCEPWNGEDEPTALRAVGSKTPVRHFMQMLTGVKRLAERASEEDLEHLIIDPPGYIDSDAGREFLFQMTDILVPDHLIALEHETDQLRPLVGPFEHRYKPAVHRIPVSSAVVNRNRPERITYRQQKFAAYFERASTHELGIDAIGFHGRIPSFDDPEQHTNQLIALCNRKGFAVTLGIVETINQTDQYISLYSPSFDDEEIASVHFGSLHLDRTGKELKQIA